jgi:hypothetical protein
VLGNDEDVDSPPEFTGRRVVVVNNVLHGTLTLTGNGGFTYQPTSGYDGPDSFTYKTDDGFWSGDPSVPLSGFSDTVTVSITVRKNMPPKK